MATNLILSKQTMSSLEIAELAGRNHKDVMRSIRDMEPAWLKVCGRNFALTSKNVEMPNGGFKETPCYELNYDECMYVASKFNDETRAKLVLRWNALETGKAEPMIYQSNPKQPTISDKMKVATWLIKTLNLNDTSKLMLAKSIAAPLGLPTPDYTPSHGMLKSATELLKEAGLSISAQAFNQRAIQKGILCDIKRKSSKGKDKHFKSITKSGLSYGENQVNPNNPKETQPLWYEEKFNELLMLLDFKLARVL